MYDKYLIVGEEFKNVKEGGKVTGFQFGLRLPYYRGVVCSLVGRTKLTVDGKEIPWEAMSVTIGGKTIKMPELENEPVHKWEFGNIGIVKVDLPGGLKTGEHKLAVEQEMKISYVPGGFWGHDEKVLSLVN
ncbi:MAG TPA: DUF6379 domain-containing protein [Anaerolineales bacterium]|nr:DUF6379 domain-containing protein [Anaerolineales bacterium]